MLKGITIVYFGGIAHPQWHPSEALKDQLFFFLQFQLGEKTTLVEPSEGKEDWAENLLKNSLLEITCQKCSHTTLFKKEELLEKHSNFLKRRYVTLRLKHRSQINRKLRVNFFLYQKPFIWKARKNIKKSLNFNSEDASLLPCLAFARCAQQKRGTFSSQKLAQRWLKKNEGMRIVRNVKQGHTLSPVDFSPPYLVKKREAVRLVYKVSPNLTLRMQALPLESGAYNEKVRVLVKPISRYSKKRRSTLVTTVIGNGVVRYESQE